MDLFTFFCNICYCTNKSLINVSSENERIKYILLSILGNPEIVNENNIYLCSSCCEELARIDKFREMCENKFLHFRQQFMQIYHTLELENDPDVIVKLKDFVEEKVLKGKEMMCHKYEEMTRESEAMNDIIFTTEVVSEELDDIKFEEFGGGTYVTLDDNQEDVKVKNIDNSNKQQDLLTEIVDRDYKIHTQVDLDKNSEEPQLVQNVDKDLNIDILRKNKHTGNTSICTCGTQGERNSNKDILTEGGVCEYSDTNHSVLITDIIIKEEYDETGSGIALENDRDDTHIVDDYKYDVLDNVVSEDIKLHTELDLSNSDEDSQSMQMNDDDTTCITEEESNSAADILTKESGSGGSYKGRRRRGRISHVCEYCNKRFLDKAKLVCHIRTHTGERPYKCSTCEKSYKRKHHLDAHTLSHTGERPYKCSMCDRSFRHKIELVDHTRTHTGERRYKCNTCDQIFTTQSVLYRHTRIHKGERPHKCSTCDRSFLSSGDLIRHTRIHTGDRPYKCTTCDRSFKVKDNLVQHARIHTDERPYKCTTCDRSFRHKGSCDSHIRTHTGERPYKCSTCGHCFTDQGNLIQHSRIHTGEKPYKCSTCDRGFRHKSNLVVHTRIHTGEKLYKCSTCERSFRSKSNLVKHTLIHTR